MSTKSYTLLAAAICLPITLAGCQTTGGGAFSNDCKVAGTGIGAVVGGVAAGMLLGKGNGRILTALAGAAAGAFIGNQIGSMLDCQDQQAAAVTAQEAGDAKVGEKLYWSTPTAEAKVAEAQKQEAQASAPVPVAASAPTAPAPKPTAEKKPNTTKSSTTTTAKTAAPAKTDPWAVKDPAPQTASTWAVREPVKSTGNSGMWGWSEPVSEPTKQADGRVCRDLRQVVVDTQGKQNAEVVKSCQDNQQRWVIASR